MKAEHLLQKNLRLLSKRNPYLSRDVERTAVPDGWVVQQARNGLPTLQAIVEERTVSIHSSYDPRREAVSWCDGLPQDWDVLVLFGFGLGYHLEEIVSRYSQRTVVVVENDLGHIRTALVYRDLTATIKQGNFIVMAGTNPVEIAGYVGQVLENNAGKQVVIRALPGYENIFKEYWKNLQSALRDLLRQFRVNTATTERFRQQWLGNFVLNFAEHLKAASIKDLFGAFSRRPAIIVAAGPSLENNVHLLNSLKKKTLIIAAGSAIRVLEKNDVQPHLLVSFDGGEANYLHFEGYQPGNVPLIFAPTIYPRIIEEYQGPKIACELNTSVFIRWFDQRLEIDKGMLASGPSVANVCLDLAVRLGADPIILVGQDLAFTNNKTHADGAKHQQAIDPGKQDFIMVEDVFGGKVPTTTAFYSMKVWFEQYLRGLQGKRLVIDASEGGAKIEGTVISTLAEVRDRYCQEDFAAEMIIKEKLKETKPEILTSKRQKLLEVIEELNQQQTQLEEYYAESIAITKELLHKIETGKVRSLSVEKTAKKLKKLDKKIFALDLYQVFIREAVAPRIEAANLVLGKKLAEESDINEMAKRLVVFYLTFFREVREYAQFVRNCLEKLGQNVASHDECYL